MIRDLELERWFGETDIESLTMSEDRVFGNTEHQFGGEGYSYIRFVGVPYIQRMNKKLPH